ncbi:MAG: SpoIIE family protein phosphatase, partial [Bdellovibrionota bacterium]
MESEQFKVSFSLGTRLLVSVVSLLLIVIVFLNLSAIFLIRDDKRAYTYQTLTTQANLAGREFANTLSRSLNTLRLSLAAIDPSKPVTLQQSNSLQVVVDNQLEFGLTAFYTVDFVNLKTTGLLFREKKDNKDLNLSPEEYAPLLSLFQPVSQELLKQGFAFQNVTKLGGTPVLAVYLADLAYSNPTVGTPIAVGFMSISKLFGNDFGNMNISIASKSGRILFDTNPARFFSKQNISGEPLFQISTANPTLNGTQEFEQNGEKFLGSYVHPGLDLIVLAKTKWKKANRSTYQLIEKFVLLGAMALGATIIFAILFSRTLTAPIASLYAATQKVAKGQFELNLPIGGSDEIAALTDSFSVMSKKIGVLIKESAVKAQLEGELAIAARVQETLIPPPTIRHKQLYVRSFYRAASQCGGDWWGFFTSGNKVYILIADATGHGFSSALITAAARGGMSAILKFLESIPQLTITPGRLLAFINQVIFDSSAGQINMTFFVAMIDLDEMTLTYSNAAHNPPWLFQKRDGKLSKLSLTCPGDRLGEIRNVPLYEEKKIKVELNDLLFLYTDGLTEGPDAEGKLYGKKRLIGCLEKGMGGGPDAVMNGILSDFYEHNGDRPLNDDITIAIAQFVTPGS